MKIQHLALLLLNASLSGCGQFFSTYDISIETRVPKPINARAFFGEYPSMCGTLSGGRCVTVGTSAWVTDTVRLAWSSGLDKMHRTKHFRVGWLPWRWPNEKYHFLFTVFPGDSATMEIQVLKRNDCSHLDPKYVAKKAYVGSSPCSW